jgi:hypothetical protein
MTIVKRTHWHIVWGKRADPERFFSLAGAHNAALAKYPATKASFIEKNTNLCEVCAAAKARMR